MTQEEKYQFARRFSRFQLRREVLHAPAINRAIRAQIADFTADYRRGANPAIILPQMDSTGIIKAIEPIYYKDAVIHANEVRLSIKMQQQKARMPMGYSERIVELMRQYYWLDILNTSQGITQTAKDWISEVLAEASQKGYTINEIVDLLTLTDLPSKRARLIARTETVTSANGAGLVAAQETGLELNKEWLAAIDNRTRKDHITANGQVVGLNGYFKVGGYDMKHPGDKGGKDGQPAVAAKEVCNCRCTTVYVPVRG